MRKLFTVIIDMVRGVDRSTMELEAAMKKLEEKISRLQKESLTLSSTNARLEQRIYEIQTANFELGSDLTEIQTLLDDLWSSSKFESNPQLNKDSAVSMVRELISQRNQLMEQVCSLLMKASKKKSNNKPKQ